MTNYVTASYSVQMPEITQVIKDYTANCYDHNHIIKSHPVVQSSSDPYRLFFKITEVGCGFTGIQKPGWQTIKQTCEIVSICSYPAHALHEIQSQPLG